MANYFQKQLQQRIVLLSSVLLFCLDSSCSKKSGSASSGAGDAPSSAGGSSSSTDSSSAPAGGDSGSLQLSTADLLAEHISTSLSTNGLTSDQVKIVSQAVVATGALAVDTSLRLGGDNNSLEVVAPKVAAAFISSVDAEAAGIDEATRSAVLGVIVGSTFEFAGSEDVATDSRAVLLASVVQAAVENSANASLSEDGLVAAVGSISSSSFTKMKEGGIDSATVATTAQKLGEKIGGAIGTIGLTEEGVPTALALASEKAGAALGTSDSSDPVDAIKQTTEGFVTGIVKSSSSMPRELRMSVISQVSEGMATSLPAWLPKEKLNSAVSNMTEAGMGAFMGLANATQDEVATYCAELAGGPMKGLNKANVSSSDILQYDLALASFQSIVQRIDASSVVLDSTSRMKLVQGSLSRSITALSSQNSTSMLSDVAPGLVTKAFEVATTNRAKLGVDSTNVEAKVESFYNGMFNGAMSGLGNLNSANQAAAAAVMPGMLANTMSAAVNSMTSVYGATMINTNILGNLPARASQAAAEQLSRIMPPADLSVAYATVTSQYLYNVQSVVAVNNPTVDFSSFSKQVSAQSLASFGGAWNASPADMQAAGAMLNGKLGGFGSAFDSKMIAAVQGGVQDIVVSAASVRNGGSLPSCSTELPDSMSDVNFETLLRNRPELVACQKSDLCPTNRTTAFNRFSWQPDPFDEKCFLYREAIVVAAAGTAIQCAAGSSFAYGIGCRPDAVTCSTGQQFIYGIGCQEKGYFCPGGQHFVSGSGCVADAVSYTCVQGQRWVTGVGCETITTQACALGLRFVSGTGCVPESNVQQCPSGTMFDAVKGCVLPVVVATTGTTTCSSGFYFNPVNGLCTPNGSCAANFYWDSASSSCRASGQCPANYVWNGSINNCQFVDTTAVICPAGQYWSQLDRVCRSEGQCSNGFYWDSSLKTCRVYGTCQAGYAWNSLASNCEVIVATTCTNCSGVAPATPESLNLSPGVENIALSWPAVEASGYILIRRAGSAIIGAPALGGIYNPPNPIGNGTVVYRGSVASFVDFSAGSGTTYFYQVYAFNGGAGGPFYSGPIGASGASTANTGGNTAPAAISNFQVNGSPGSISLSWSSFSATGVMILRSQSSPVTAAPAFGINYSPQQAIGASVVVFRANANAYTDPNVTSGVTYHYAIYAYNNGTSGPVYSSPSTGNASPASGGGTTPTLPSDVSVVPTASNIAITWSGPTATGYMILRRLGAVVSATPETAHNYAANSVLGSDSIVYVGQSKAFTDYTAAVGNTYYYKIFAFNAGNGGPFYSPGATTTGALNSTSGGGGGGANGGGGVSAGGSTPPTPSNLNISPTSSSMGLSWASSSVAGYVVFRKQGQASTFSPVDGVTYAVSNAAGDAVVAYVGTSNTPTDSGLSASQMYYYKIYSFVTGSGGPFYSAAASISASTPSGGGGGSTPAAPGSFNANPTGASIDLSWASGSAAGYLIVRHPGTAVTGSPTNGSTYSLNDALGNGNVSFVGTATATSDTNVSSGTSYYYKIFAYVNGSGGPFYSPASSINATFSGGGQTSPSAPANLVASPSAGAIDLNWDSDTVTGFLVLRRQGGSITGDPVDGVGYNTSATIGNATVVYKSSPNTFSDSGLSASQQYFYKVYAFVNGTGGPFYSAASSVIETVPSNGGNPAAPTGLQSTPSAGSVALTWNTASVSGFVVVRKLGMLTGAPADGTPYSNADALGNGTVVYVGGTNSFTDTGLTDGSQYYYNVYAFQSSGYLYSGATSIIATPGAASWPINDSASSTSQFRKLAVDSAGNIYAVGGKKQSGQNYNGLAKKYTPSASYSWFATTNGSASGGFDMLNAVAIDVSGEIIVAGVESNTTRGNDWTIKRLDHSDGSVLNTISFDGGQNGNEEATSVAVSASGEIYVGGDKLTATGSRGMIQKFNSSLATINTPWPLSFNPDSNTSTADKVVALKATGDNSTGKLFALVSTGTSYNQTYIYKINQSDGGQNSISLSPGYEGRDLVVSGTIVYVVGTITNTTPTKFFIKKFDFSAAPTEVATNWNKYFSAPNSKDAGGEAAAIDADGNLIVGGWGIDLLGSTGKDMWLKKYQTSNGGEVTAWDKKFNTSNKDDIVYSVAAASAGNGAHIYVGGLVDFDIGTADKEIYSIDKLAD